MLFLATLILLAASAVPGIRCEKTGCNEEILVNCIAHTSPTLDFGTFKEELDTVCPELLSGVRCVDNYTKNCLDPEKRSQFNKLYSEMSMTTQDICQEGPYQDEYLRHGPCMMVLKKANCSKDYNHALSEFNHDLNTKICCSLRKFIRCSTDVVRKTCGHQTAKFASGFLDRITNALQVTHCQGFSGECGGDSSGMVRTRRSGWMLAVTAAMAFFTSGLGH